MSWAEVKTLERGVKQKIEMVDGLYPRLYERISTTYRARITATSYGVPLNVFSVKFGKPVFFAKLNVDIEDTTGKSGIWIIVYPGRFIINGGKKLIDIGYLRSGSPSVSVSVDPSLREIANVKVRDNAIFVASGSYYPDEVIGVPATATINAFPLMNDAELICDAGIFDKYAGGNVIATLEYLQPIDASFSTDTTGGGLKHDIFRKELVGKKRKNRSRKIPGWKISGKTPEISEGRWVA